ncbi:MAG: PAS domain S-box protein [Anaerolineae bacterium]|nr:PAS domain S-box protein [Anaerolineae bacterium]
MALSQWHRLQRFVQPSSGSVPDPVNWHKVRIYSVFLIGVAALTGLMTVFYAMTDPVAERGFILLGVGIVGSTLMLYGLNRTRHHELSVALFIVLNFLAVILSIVIHEFSPFFLLSMLGSLNAAVLLTTALLSFRWTVGTATAGLLVTLITILSFVTDHPATELFYILLFNILIALFIVLVALMRRQDQQQLVTKAFVARASEMHYRRLFEAIPDPVWVCEQGIFIDVNPAFERVFRYRRDEIAGQPLRKFLSPQAYATYQTGVNAPDTAPLETAIVTKDGTSTPMEISIYAYSFENRTVQVTVARDITARKQMEQDLKAEQQLLRTVVDMIPDRIYVKDRHSRFLLVNAALQAERPGQQFIGRTDHDLLDARYANPYLADEEHLFTTGEALVNQEHHITAELSANGQEFWLLVTKIPMRDSHGDIIGLVGINRDITRQKQAEFRLEEERNLLRTVIDHLPDEVYVKDTASHFVMVNQMMLKVYDGRELIGKSDHDFLPAESADQFRREEQRLFASGESIIGREYYAPPELSLQSEGIWLLETKVPLYDNGGHIIGMVGINRDITRQKDIERRLELERNLLRSVIDNIPEHIYVKGLDHRVILANRAVNERWQRDIVGLTDRDLLPAARADEAFASEDRLFQSGEPLINYENYGHHVDGSPLWVLISKMLLRDPNGQITGMVGINRDITELKLAEIAIREERNLLRSVIDTMRDSVYVKDREHRFLMVNQAVSAGWAEGLDLIGRTDRDLSIPTELAAHFEAEEALILSDNLPHVTKEMLITDPDGERRWLMISKVPLRDSEQRIIGLVGVNHDITERKLFEEHLRYHSKLLGSISDAVISTDLDFIVVSWNKGAEHLYGWRAEEVVGQLVSDIFATEFIDGSDTDSSIRQLFAAGSWSGEVIQTDAHGQRLHVLNVTSLIRDEQGKPTGVIAVNRDITDKIAAEEQRMELALERERVKILRQVISDMSHDLKNPLANFRTSLYLLARFLDVPDKRQMHLDTLNAQSERLEIMLDDLLNMSRLEQATDEFQFELVDVAALAQQVVHDQQPLAVRRSHHLTFQSSVELPPIRADRLKLSRALVNLVMNALNYTPKGGEVAVRLVTRDDYLVLEVEDNGIGISDKDQPLIFERFYRADKARNSETGGTGLGLSIARRITEEHGGKITLDSTPGQGSRFSIWLPLHFSLE